MITAQEAQHILSIMVGTLPEVMSALKVTDATH